MPQGKLGKNLTRDVPQLRVTIATIPVPYERSHPPKENTE
jgi:hypothetical protein